MKKLFIPGAVLVTAACSVGNKPHSIPESASVMPPKTVTSPSLSPAVEQVIKTGETAFEASIKQAKRVKVAIMMGVCSTVAANDGFYTIPNPATLSFDNPEAEGRLTVTVGYDPMHRSFIYGSVVALSPDGGSAQELPGSPQQVDAIPTGGDPSNFADQYIHLNQTGTSLENDQGIMVASVGAFGKSDKDIKDYASSDVARLVCEAAALQTPKNSEGQQTT